MGRDDNSGSYVGLDDDELVELIEEDESDTPFEATQQLDITGSNSGGPAPAAPSPQVRTGTGNNLYQSNGLSGFSDEFPARPERTAALEDSYPPQSGSYPPQSGSYPPDRGSYPASGGRRSRSRDSYPPTTNGAPRRSSSRGAVRQGSGALSSRAPSGGGWRASGTAPSQGPGGSGNWGGSLSEGGEEYLGRSATASVDEYQPGSHPSPSVRSNPSRGMSSRSLGPGPEEEVDEFLGQVLGTYRVVSRIGEGGMGQVYLAEHVRLGRKVALKLLRPEYAVKRDAVQRFFNEAQAVNRIGHENIVDITDFVELEDGNTFIIMELLQGEDLADIQRKKGQPMPLHRAMQIAMQVCDALEAAHKTGIIHRDLKPDNIFIVNSGSKKDFVKLLDFGVAKLLGGGGSMSLQTQVGSVIGTPAYMSPEQATGIPVDSRSDIYSLGAILYELFTGHPVFRAKSFGEYVVKHMNDEPVAPRNLADAPRIPMALERVILRCLEKDPQNRYQSVAELRDDLARATATVETVLDENVISASGTPSRRRIFLLVPLVLVVAAAAVTAFWFAAGLNVDDHAPPGGPHGEGLSGPTAVPSEAGAVEEDPSRPLTRPIAGDSLAKITLATTPEGAAVYRTDAPTIKLGETPLVLNLNQAGEEIAFSFRLDGYRERTERVLVAPGMVVSVSLQPSEESLSSKKPADRGAKDDGADGAEGKRVKLKTRRPKRGRGRPRRPPRKKTPQEINPEDVVNPFE